MKRSSLNILLMLGLSILLVIPLVNVTIADEIESRNMNNFDIQEENHLVPTKPMHGDYFVSE